MSDPNFDPSTIAVLADILVSDGYVKLNFGGNLIDPAQEVIGRDEILQPKLIEQRLLRRQTSHHGHALRALSGKGITRSCAGQRPSHNIWGRGFFIDIGRFEEPIFPVHVPTRAPAEQLSTCNRSQARSSSPLRLCSSNVFAQAKS